MGGVVSSGILTGTEDCLYLDIKIPKHRSPQLLPVMFWIHGGGNTSDSKTYIIFQQWLIDMMLLLLQLTIG